MPPASFKDELIAEMSTLRAFAISLSGSVSLADDLVQETLLRAWSKSDKFQPGTSLRAWLFTILRNFYYSSYRKQAREVQDSDGAYAQRLNVSGDHQDLLEPLRTAQPAGAKAGRREGDLRDIPQRIVQ
jgi:RNA polymerase sigma-70 factor (ECF subfamily)